MAWKPEGRPVGSSVISANFRAVLKIQSSKGGFDTHDISSLSLNFGMNKIPVANCTLAVGRNTSTANLTQAAIHSSADDFVSTRPAQIILRPSGAFGTGKGLWDTAGDTVIFDGYVAGLGYRRTERTAVPVVTLTHWIADMAFSSILSESSHPANPARFRWINNPAGGVVAVPDSLDEFVSTHVRRELLQPENFMGGKGDMWGKVLHPMFADLSDKDVLWKFGEDDCITMKDVNESLQLALKRIETSNGGNSDEPGTDYKVGAKSPYYMPLQLEQGFIPNLVANSLYAFLHKMTLDSYFNSTAWDKIAGELAPALYFSIIPRVQTATVAPFVPGLRQTYRKSIDFRDVSDWSSSFNSIRPLRAVGVLPTNLMSQAGESPGVPVNVLGGCYSPGPKNRPGMVIYKTPPRWLDQVPLHSHDPDLNNAASRSSTTPQAPQAPPAGAPPLTPADAMNSMQNYYGKSARYMFAQEMLRGRSAVLQGKLRFDIAPGSTVKIINTPQKFLQNDKLAVNFVGSVTRVGVIIDAENATASTSFQIDYLRTEAENKENSTSIDGHPLYEVPPGFKEPYTGAPLLHQYLFPDD
jgi:hypothetical protein